MFIRGENMLIVNANIKLYGNRINKKQISSGWRCSLEVDGELIMCAIYPREEGSYINVDVYANADIHLPYGEIFLNQIVDGYKFKLREASKILGEGETLQILEIEVEEQNIIALGNKEKAISIVKKANELPNAIVEDKVLRLLK